MQFFEWFCYRDQTAQKLTDVMQECGINKTRFMALERDAKKKKRERKREKESESVSVCVSGRQRERERECVCVR